MAAVLAACAIAIQVTPVHIVLAQQTVTVFPFPQTAISAAAMATGFLPTGSLVLCRANLGTVSLVLSRRALSVSFPLSQYARPMWIVWEHGQSVQTTACRRHLQ